MPLGIVSDDIFDAELEKLSGQIKEEKHGRNEGDVNIPEPVRKIIGDTAITNGRKDALALAEFLDVSPSSVSAYSNGSRSTATYNKPGQLKDFIKEKKFKVVKRANKNLVRALDHMTEDKFQAASLTELASAAKAMGGIIKDMHDVTEGSDIKGPQVAFIIHTPPIAREDKFDVIDVTE